MSVTDICIPKDLPVLKDLDVLLRCGICYEYMKTAMITNCSHNYCSLCIRKSLMYKGQCPACFEEAFDSQLRNNKIVDEFIIIFSRLSIEVQKFIQDSRGNKPLQYIKDSGNDKASTSNVDNVSRRLAEVESLNTKFSESPNKASTSFFASKKREPKKLSVIEDDFSKATSEQSFLQKSESKSTAKLEPQIPSMFTPKKMSIKPVIVTPVNLVPCPVCSVGIPERNINAHLDACLKRSEMAQESSPKQIQRRKPLAKLVYSLLNDKELKKKLKDLGLSINGDRKALISRHQRFTLLYNSECDNQNPRPVADIIQQIEREEKDEKKPVGISSMLRIDRKTDSKVIEQAQQQYIQQNKKSFEDLIKAVRNRENAKQLPMKRNQITSDDEEDGVSESIPCLWDPKEQTKRNSFKNCIEDDEDDDIDDDDVTDISNISANENNLNEISGIENMDGSIELISETNSTEPVSPVFCRNATVNPRKNVGTANNASTPHKLTPDMFMTPPNDVSGTESNDSLSILTQRTPEETPVSEVTEKLELNDVDPSDTECEEPLKTVSSQLEDPDFEPYTEASDDFDLKKRPARRKRKVRNNQRPSVNHVETTERRTLRKRVKL